MNKADILSIQVAAVALAPRIPTVMPLSERLKYAFKATAEDDGTLFFLTLPTDDIRFKTAIAAVGMHCTQEELDLIARSMAPLNTLSAMMSGVQVNLDAFADSIKEDLLPLLVMYREAGGQ